MTENKGVHVSSTLRQVQESREKYCALTVTQHLWFFLRVSGAGRVGPTQDPSAPVSKLTSRLRESHHTKEAATWLLSTDGMHQGMMGNARLTDLVKLFIGLNWRDSD